ncbi:MAG: hypothetical protein Q7T56_08785 [Nocardioidaceae bacterium]|nr:hypothetical protein [Nocardioidaceae bacterium]
MGVTEGANRAAAAYGSVLAGKETQKIRQMMEAEAEAPQLADALKRARSSAQQVRNQLNLAEAKIAKLEKKLAKAQSALDERDASLAQQTELTDYWKGRAWHFEVGPGSQAQQ